MGSELALLAVGGSAGSLPPLIDLVAGLPADLDAAVLVTVHVPPRARSQLPQVLARAGPLTTVHARAGEPLVAGRIHVAPPDAHLVVDGASTALSAGPRVNGNRPSIDVMLATAARSCGPAVVAVVLSGALDDGAVGAAMVAAAGGSVLVQAPSDAHFASMPQAALDAAPGARAVGATELGEEAVRLLSGRLRRERVEDHGVDEASMATSGDPLYLAPDEARLTRLTCPDCAGVLAQVDLPRITYYRCHVGHQWSPQSLVDAQAEVAEHALWSAVALLDEQAALGAHLAQRPGGADARAPSGVRGESTRSRRRGAEGAAALAAVMREHLHPDAAGGADGAPDPSGRMSDAGS